MGNQSTALRPEVMSDLEDHTLFTAQEIHEYYQNFMKECPEMRMTLSLEEFQHLYIKIFPKGDSSKFAAHVFRNFDQDGNGKIDFREFLGALSVQIKGRVEERLKWLFNLYDIDGTGFISREELLEMLTSMHRLKGETVASKDAQSPEQLVEYIMEKADENRDDQLSEQEFIMAAVRSKTLQQILIGTLAASSSAFNTSKKSGSTTN